MNNRLESLLAQIKELEKELVLEAQKKEQQFCYQINEKKVQFTEAAKARHKELKLSVHHYLFDSDFFILLTVPVIWMCLLPMLLADIVGCFYQFICFPIYGIPKVNRCDYISFDRHKLSYLNFIEKMNCEYCAYVNGILAFCTEIAARTEQYWCPIKHAGCAKCSHSRYKNFVDYGDAEQYRQKIAEIRRDFKDVEASESFK